MNYIYKFAIIYKYIDMEMNIKENINIIYINKCIIIHKIKN